MKTRNFNNVNKLYVFFAAAWLALAASTPAPAQTTNAGWDSQFGVNGLNNGDVFAIALAPNGHLFAGGSFTLVGGISARGVAEWDGISWSPLGTNGVVGIVYAIAVDSNNNVYVGGDFTVVGSSVIAGRIAMWDGVTWSDLDGGMNNGEVRAIVVDSDDNVYAGGSFNVAGGNTALRVAMWDGVDWTDVGGGINNGTVYALALAANGDLYVGGSFTVAGGTTAVGVAKWDGNSWSDLGGGMNLSSEVFALTFTQSGDLYAGGSFTVAGGIIAGRVARWNGFGWSDLNGGLTDPVYALDAQGNDLYVGGAFTVTGDGPALRIAKWDGIEWSNFGEGVSNLVYAVRKRGDNLYVGGRFTSAGLKSSLRFGRYNPNIVPVLIQGFTARPTEDRVDLEWRVFADEPVTGFRIYKKLSGDDAFVLLNNSGLIPVGAQSYRDNDVRAGELYHYQLAAVTPEGHEFRSQTVEARVPESGIILEQNFPNPFNPITTIRFSAPEAIAVHLAVYDAKGGLVITLFDGIARSGAREVQWNGRDAAGAPVSTGVYFYRLQAGKQTLTRKMLLLK
ncbi:MAG: T9SS type A sorting domain-containing protein [Candidatus Krumholzibacteria bacterium]|nr:T9SS type A sorting domain-containing protein [Candidatus Krumholzibacteria bacterium]